MTGFAVFFRDLKPQVQDQLLEDLRLEKPEEANWHQYPLALINHTSNPELPSHAQIP